MPKRQFSLNILYLAIATSFDTISFTASLQNLPPNVQLSRREAAIIGGGGVLAAFYYAKALEALLSPPIEFPFSHEERVRRVLQTTLRSGSPVKSGQPTTQTIRILEVGIGSTARLIRRGLYDFEPAEMSVNIIGLDPKPPTSKAVLEDIAQHTPSNVSLELRQGSITEKTSFPDGYFDAVVCCLTLCSVDDPELAVREMKRLVRPGGGSFGFCEHVAAADESFLGKQQLLLDPLQQRVADNCHLHRKSRETIRTVFGTDAEWLFEEEFNVDAMWPVSFQSCGVLQMK